jgi:hypothetical protein
MPLLLRYRLAARHKDVWGIRGIAPLFLASALDEGDWSASRPSRFATKERGPGTYWIGD